MTNLPYTRFDHISLPFIHCRIRPLLLHGEADCEQ